MTKVGILLVSHSKNLAQGIIDLVSEVAKDIPITYCGGLEDCYTAAALLQAGADLETILEQLKELTINK